MKKLLLLLCSFGLYGCAAGAESTIDNSTVDSLDVARYMGRWYEIARYETSFEKGMTNVTATYTLKPDGKISVLNEGIKDGKLKQAEGKGRQPNPSDPGKLEVSFFLWFYADYYIMELDPEYRYVVIGSSSDKYLWIMSRTPTMPEDTYNELVSRLQKRGYDTSLLLKVKQD